MAHRKRTNAATHRKKEEQRREKAQETRRLILGIGIITVAFAVIFFVVGAAILNSPGSPVGVRPGQVAPDFEITDVDGNRFRLSDHRGRPVLLDFMGSRCPTCVQEMPELVQTYQTYNPRGLVMISIDIGGSLGTEDPQVARAFLATYGGSWPIALDNQGLGLTYQARALPTVYVVDPDGRIALAHPGVIVASDLAQAIEPLL